MSYVSRSYVQPPMGEGYGKWDYPDSYSGADPARIAPAASYAVEAWQIENPGQPVEGVLHVEEDAGEVAGSRWDAWDAFERRAEVLRAAEARGAAKWAKMQPRAPEDRLYYEQD